MIAEMAKNCFLVISASGCIEWFVHSWGGPESVFIRVVHLNGGAFLVERSDDHAELLIPVHDGNGGLSVLREPHHGSRICAGVVEGEKRRVAVVVCGENNARIAVGIGTTIFEAAMTSSCAIAAGSA